VFSFHLTNKSGIKTYGKSKIKQKKVVANNLNSLTSVEVPPNKDEGSKEP